MAFSAYWSYLGGMVPELSPLHAQVLVNRAWEDIRDEGGGLWSFLVAEAFPSVPAAVTGGTVTVTQDSATVTADVTAKTALDAVATDLPNRQFRLSSAGPLYGISAYSTITGIITLDRTFQEDSGSLQTYQVYKAYIQAPVADFRRWETFVDPVLNRPLLTNWTKDEINRRDPQRTSQGDPDVVAAHRHHSTTGYPMFELWPHAMNRRSYVAIYIRRGSDLSDTVDLPATFPRGLLLDRALWRAYEWAEANKDRSKKLENSNWPFLMGKADKAYRERLVTAKKADRETYNRQWSNSRWAGTGLSNLDGDLLQTTDPFLLAR